MSARFTILMLILATSLAVSACAGSDREPSGATLANPASVYCEEQGGQVEIRTDDTGGEYGVCIFEDGSECEEWAFYREECEPGQFDTAPVP